MVAFVFSAICDRNCAYFQNSKSDGDEWQVFAAIPEAGVTEETRGRRELPDSLRLPLTSKFAGEPEGQRTQDVREFSGGTKKAG